MALSYETVEVQGENNPTLAGAAQATEILQHFQQEVQVATGQAVERAMSYAEKVAQTLITDMRKQLEGFAKPSERVMVVKVDEIKRKLSKAASPYLGEALIQAKIGINTLLVGPAGCGKTTLAEQVAEAVGMRFGYISLTMGASETWIVGRWTAKGEFINAEFTDFYKNGGVFLLDEVDAADANLLMLINTALSQPYMLNPMTGEKMAKHKDFICVAAANTFGKGGNIVYTGRNRLDGAFLNRFACGIIEMDYVDAIEAQLCPDTKLRKKLQKARKFLKEKNSNEMVTTRDLSNAYALKSQGVEEKRIMEKLTASWPKELADQSGLLKDAPKEEPAGESEPF
jgi:cobaltochelatase CobS